MHRNVVGHNGPHHGPHLEEENIISSVIYNDLFSKFSIIFGKFIRFLINATLIQFKYKYCTKNQITELFAN